MGRNIPDEEKCQTWFGISLLNLCLFIATLDLVHSLYFLVNSIKIMMTYYIGVYALISFFGSLLWLITVMLLFVGLCTLRVRFVLFWLVFSVIGTMMDIFLVIWTIAISDHVQGVQIAEFTLLYLGIITEWLCIYTVYKYFMMVKNSEGPNLPEDGRIDLSNEESSPFEPSTRKPEMNLENSGRKQNTLIETIEIPRATDVSKEKKKARK